MIQTDQFVMLPSENDNNTSQSVGMYPDELHVYVELIVMFLSIRLAHLRANIYTEE